MRHAVRCILGVLLAVGVAAGQGEASHSPEYHSLWKLLEQEQQRIPPLPSPEREKAQAQYQICCQKLETYCSANDLYVSACKSKADAAERKRLGDASTHCWEQYLKSLPPLSQAIGAGERAARASQVRPGENATKVATPSEQTDPGAAPGAGAGGPPATGAPPPGAPPGGVPSPAPVPPLRPAIPNPQLRPAIPMPPLGNRASTWFKQQLGRLQRLSQTAQGALGPSLTTAAKALDAYTKAQEAYRATSSRQGEAQTAAERQTLLQELRKEQAQVQTLAEDYATLVVSYQKKVMEETVNDLRQKEAARQAGAAVPGGGGAPQPQTRRAATDSLGAYLAGVRSQCSLLDGGAGDAGTLGNLLALTSRAGLTASLAGDLRVLERDSVAGARARGERLGKKLRSALAGTR